VPAAARGHCPAPQQHTHLDCVSWSAWPDCNRAGTLAHLGRLVAAHDVGPRRVGYRSSRRPLPDLLRRSHGPLVCRRSLRLSATYIELHASSAFSFLEGASLPEELIAACAEYSMPAIALLDRDGVYGAPRFHLAAKKAGIQAHIGGEVTSTTGVRSCRIVSASIGGNQRRSLRCAGRTRDSRCVHLDPQSPHFGNRRPPACKKFRLLFEDPRVNGPAFP